MRFLLVCLVGGLKALECYTCTTIGTSTDCTDQSTETCKKGEVCTTMQIIDGQKTIYMRECGPIVNNGCTEEHDATVCYSSCETNLCNTDKLLHTTTESPMETTT